MPIPVTERSKARVLLEVRVQIPPGTLMIVLCGVSKDKKTKYRTVKTKKAIRMKYKRSTREQKKNWLRHCITSRKVAGSIPDGVIGTFHRLQPSGRTKILRSTQPLIEMSTMCFPSRVKAAGA
jgi:hypothetical protein